MWRQGISSRGDWRRVAHLPAKNEYGAVCFRAKRAISSPIQAPTISSKADLLRIIRLEPLTSRIRFFLKSLNRRVMVSRDEPMSCACACLAYLRLAWRIRQPSLDERAGAANLAEQPLSHLSQRAASHVNSTGFDASAGASG